MADKREILPASDTCGTTKVQRLRWQRPAVKRLNTQDSETGVNSTVDLNNTFS
jgi:hypothetical protein